jgi:ribonucleoside-diphosphate reductase alpha chain
MSSSPAGDPIEDVLRAATSALNGDAPNGYALDDVLRDQPPLRGEALHAPIVEVESEIPGLEITANSMEVLRRRYLAKDRKGEIVETPDEMFRRVARNLAEGDRVEEPGHDIEPIEEEFYQMLARLEFLPNSPTLMNAGRELQQLSACFVLPVPDNMEGIFESATHTALIHKSGGGTGFGFSQLRPENDVVGSTGGVASGPVSFIKIFDTATDVVKQGGTRRGANMGILNVEHPDILKFIHVKDDDRSLQNFNISVALTERFMEKARSGEEYELFNPRTGRVAGSLNAAEVYEQLVNSAWKTGDPGIVFIDRINADHPTPHEGLIEATNPCGEQPLMAYESCNLGSINLAKMVKEAGPEDAVEVDWDRLERTVFTSVRFLDNVVTMNRYPVSKIEEVTKRTRKIGLGVMGWADLLLMLGVPYDSNQAVEIAENVMGFIQKKADEASIALAEERGVFPAWKGSVYEHDGGPRFRNSTRTTIAPTGTISIIAGCSSGCEPLFALSYVRTVMDGTRLVEVNPHFEAVARREGFYSSELMEELAARGSVRGMPGVPEWVQRVFVTSHDISPEWHVRMQAAFQRYTDNAVSKTVNFSHDAGVEDVRMVYDLAYDLGCKGVTIYRDGSKSMQVLSTGQTEKARSGETADEAPQDSPAVLQEAEEIATGPIPRRPRERPRAMVGRTHKVRTGNGTMYVTVNIDETGKPFEVFSQLGKAGTTDAAHLEAISRLISLSLRAGVDIESIIHHLKGITSNPIWDDGVLVASPPDAVALVLAKYLPGENGEPPELWNEPTMQAAQFGLFNPGKTEEQAEAAQGAKLEAWKEPEAAVTCPDCSGVLTYQEGCLMCHACGFNKCG